MLHAHVQRFDVMGTVGKFLETILGEVNRLHWQAKGFTFCDDFLMCGCKSQNLALLTRSYLFLVISRKAEDVD